MLDISDDDNSDDDDTLLGLEEAKENADDAENSEDEDDDDEDDEEDLEQSEDELDKNDPNFKKSQEKAKPADAKKPAAAPAKPAAAEAKPPTSAKVQIGEKFPEEAGPTTPAGYEEIPASRAGADERGGYQRKVPAQFTQERDDRLMNSLITKYAREVRRDGHNTGHMFLNKDDARAAADEVLKDHKDNTAVDKVDFEGTWDHFDVNKDGLVEVERMP